MKRRIAFVCMIGLLACGIVGCGIIQKRNTKWEEVPFNVMKESALPEEIKEIVEEKKQMGFECTYQCEGELYLMKGYGIQSSGGYSIQVEYVRENEETIHIKTQLLGPESRQEQNQGLSSPYVVV